MIVIRDTRLRNLRRGGSAQQRFQADEEIEFSLLGFHGGASALIATAAVQFLNAFVEERFRAGGHADLVAEGYLPLGHAGKEVRGVHRFVGLRESQKLNGVRRENSGRRRAFDEANENLPPGIEFPNRPASDGFEQRLFGDGKVP